MTETKVPIDLSSAMDKLVQAIEKASPIIWQAAHRQVFVELIELIFVLVILLFAARYLYNLRYRVMNRPKSEDGYNRGDDADDPVPILCIIGICVFLGISLILSIYIIDYSLNPTYIAIKELRGLL